MKVNIPKTINDPFYRYQRDIIKIENVKLGIKIVNLDLICKQSYLDENTVLKYIKKKLGCNVKNNIIYLNDVNIKQKLEDILEELILNNLCFKCNNPEVVNKKCQACGNKID